ncbi:TonB-dependent receptor plug domain-containing protein, partial [Sandarakinorhabdus rubra]|uniref:TonB-dependent receptor plug domain-containing protein n=1 Tax=Sandarakinorhabdus rubra TaxID=2672568 RepID=UPI0013DD4AFE
MPITLPDPPPPIVTAHVLGEDRLRQRGAVLATEALADWTLLAAARRGLALGGLPGTLVTLDGLRLTPAADGRFDLSLLPLSLLAEAALTAGPSGAALGAGALAGSAQLSLAPSDAGSRGLALAGGQAGQGIAGLDLRLGGSQGWLAGGYTFG